jgi:PAS domain S-box-containing protein
LPALAARSELRPASELEVYQRALEHQIAELQQTNLRLFDLLDLYECAPVGYVTTTHEGQVQAANLRFAQMLSKDRAALIRRPLYDFIDARDQDLYYLHRQALKGGAAKQTCELRLRRNGGEVFWAMLESIVVTDLNGLALVRTAVSDVTEFRQAEEERRLLREQLQHSQKADALGTLAGAVAHEIDELMPMTLGLGDQLERHLPADEANAQVVRDLMSRLLRGRKLVQDMLDLTHTRPHPRLPCDPNETIRQVIAVVESLLPNGVSLESSLDGNVCDIECDPELLTQLVMTLCWNSIDTLGQCGTLSIATRQLAPGDQALSRFPKLLGVPCLEIAISCDSYPWPRAVEAFTPTEHEYGLGWFMFYGAVHELGGVVATTDGVNGRATMSVLLPVDSQGQTVSTQDPGDKPTRQPTNGWLRGRR